MILRLAYSTNAYMRFDLLDSLRRIAALGFRGVELMADTPHLWPADTTSKRLDEVRAELDRLGLTISNINAFMMNKIGDKRQPYWHPSWIEPDVAYRRIRIDHTKAALTMAKHLGAPHITTEPGGPIAPGLSYSDCLDLFVEMLKPVVDHAEREGVRLLIEPEPGLLIERFDHYLELADRVKSPFLALNFDIGHAFCVGDDIHHNVEQFWYGLRRVSFHIHHCHIEDIAATRVHEHLIPGRGVIDFAQVFRSLGGDYFDLLDRWVTVELYPYIDDPDAAGREAKAYLEEIAASL